MRVLLAGVLILLPFYAQGQIPSASAGEQGSRPSAAPIDPSVTEQSTPIVPENTVEDQTLGPFTNPYGPASATNFDPFAAPLIPSPALNDRNRLSAPDDYRSPIGSIYGHFGNPLFPGSIANRGETAHPFAMDSSTNLYGRGGTSQGRE